ncbi:MAG TPA: LamG-like jellyroll fold domain-containing protein, partial [Verrucomicrobiae bacterium]
MNPIKKLLLASTLLAGLSLQATVTPVRFYHLGEDDASASNRLVATSSADSVSTNALSFTGAPKYWVEAAPADPVSSCSILFSTADQGSAAVVTNIDNVCLEAWASTGWRNTHVIAYNGNSSLDGYGIILNQTNYLAVLGGIGTVATVPCPPGYWMHLALVCQNGTVAFYTNGILAAITNATPNPPTGNLTVGGPNTVAPFVDA